MKTRVGFDTETDLIEPGLKAPPLVCFTVSDGSNPTEFHTWHNVHRLWELWSAAARGEIVLVGQNIAYDACVTMAHKKEFIPVVFEAYANDGVEDLMLREMLLMCERHGRPRRKSLDDLSRQYLDLALDKDEDGWRLRFGELKHLPAADYPERAVEYAKGDAWVVPKIYRLQDEKARHADTFADSFAQSRAHLAFTLMAAWGFKTNKERVAGVRDALRDMQADREEYLVLEGVMRPTKEQKATFPERFPGWQWDKTDKGKAGAINKQKLWTKLMELGADLPETPASTPEKRTYSLAGEYLEVLDLPLADTYLEFDHDRKMLNTYLSKYESGLVQCSINPLLANGRTSLSKPSLQNLPTAGPLRESFEGRPGTYLCSVDYDGIELRSDAQNLLWHFGQSKIAEMFQQDPDADLHSIVAARILGIPEAEALQRKKAKDPAFKEVRDKQAKRAVFGLAGGMGLAVFDSTLRKEKVFLTQAQLEKIKEAYLDAFPEKRQYFKMIGSMLPRRRFPEDRPRTDMQCWVSGRWRGKCTFTQLANGFFSSLMTDGSKAATFEVVRACYDPTRQSVLFGARVVNAVHDELVAEVDQAGAHEQGFAISKIMCDTMMECYTPDIPVTAEPALMERWHKGASPVYDNNGRLTLWRPAEG